MPRRTWSWVVRPITTILMTMVLAVAGIAAALPASAAEPIAPTQLDRCGTEQNQYVIPFSSAGDVYYLGSTYLEPATYTVPAGTTSVTITSYGMTNGSWTFNYTNEGPCGPEATNTMAVDIRPCDPATGLTEVLVTYTNVADSTGWYDSDVYVEAFLKERGFVNDSRSLDGMLLDGQSVTFDLGDPTPNAWDLNEGLTPGTYVFTARHSRGGLVTSERRIESCGTRWPFPGTPPTTPTTPVDTLTGKVSARIVPGRVVTHRVCMNARKVKGKGVVKFRVERKAGKKVKVIKRAKVAAGSKRCYKVKAKRGSILFVSVRNIKTDDWERVARKRIKR